MLIVVLPGLIEILLFSGMLRFVELGLGDIAIGLPLFDADADAGMMTFVSSCTCVWNPGTVGVHFFTVFQVWKWNFA